MKVDPITDKEQIKDCQEYLKAKNERNYVLFCIGIYTGLRISDILKLKVKDVYHKNRIYIKQQKTNKYIDIPINNKLKKIINAYIERKSLSKWSYLIQSRNGHNNPLSRRQAYNILNDMADYFDMEHIGTHTLRKTCGYNLYYATDKDIGMVMKLLGHKDMKNTLRYIGVEQMELDKAVRKLSY